MEQLSLRQLRMFVSVAHSQHLGISAEQLFVTRGALSQGLKTLESQLGKALFERHGGRLHLNSHGHQLLPLAEELLSREQQLLMQFNQGVPLAPLRLGASATIGNYLLPSVLANQWPDNWSLPKVTLSNSQQLQRLLLDRQLDFALIESERIEPSLNHRHWLDDTMVVVASPNHPLANQQVNWQQLSQQPWVLRESSSGSREQFDHHLAPHLEHVDIAIELATIESGLATVSAGVGIALVSHHAAQGAIQQGRLSQLHLPIEIPRRLSLVYPSHLPQLDSLLYVLNIPQ